MRGRKPPRWPARAAPAHRRRHGARRQAHGRSRTIFRPPWPLPTSSASASRPETRATHRQAHRCRADRQSRFRSTRLRLAPPSPAHWALRAAEGWRRWAPRSARGCADSGGYYWAGPSWRHPVDAPERLGGDTPVPQHSCDAPFSDRTITYGVASLLLFIL